jgi:DNA-binding beta-propeller fold protein YncE
MSLRLYDRQRSVDAFLGGRLFAGTAAGAATAEEGSTMRKLALLTALLCALAVAVGGGSAGNRHNEGGTVFETERSLGSVSAFDAATGEVLWSSKTGLSPIGVTRPRGTEKVYTSDEGSNQMSVFDEETGTLLTTIPMGAGPHHQMASRNGKRIYVGEFFQNTVGVVDTRSDTEIANWVANPDPLARTHAVFITRNGKDLYATDTRLDRTQPGDVAHLDARTGERLCNIMVGADPSEILVRSNGKIGYVSVRRENKIKELDLRGDCPRLTGREAVIGTMPDTLHLTHDGRTLIVTLRGVPAQISYLDTETFAVQIVDIPGHVTTGHHWLSGDDRYTYVASETPGSLSVVDNETRAVVADYAYPTPGGVRPHGVFFVRDVLKDEDSEDD